MNWCRQQTIRIARVTRTTNPIIGEVTSHVRTIHPKLTHKMSKRKTSPMRVLADSNRNVVVAAREAKIKNSKTKKLLMLPQQNDLTSFE